MAKAKIQPQSNVPTLAVLLNDAAQLESALLESGGEITPEIEELLVVRETKIPAKIDAYKYRIDRFDVAAAYLKEQETKLAKLRKSFESAADRVRDGLLMAMEANEVAFLDGIDYEAAIKLNPASVLVTDEASIPENFITIETIKKIDKRALAAHMKEFGEIPGAQLERSKKVVFNPMLKKVGAQ
jgi:hypothetical protein